MTLYVLVGMIASGKSTYSRERAKSGALIVNDDSIITSLHGAYAYDRSLRPVYKALQETVIRLGLLAGRDVVVDSTHLTAKSRLKMLELARECDAKCVAVVFPVAEPEIHAYRRWMSDSRGLDYDRWLTVAKEHHKKIEPVAEPFDEVVFRIDTPLGGS